jgi:hypothetical protein
MRDADADAEVKVEVKVRVRVGSESESAVIGWWEPGACRVGPAGQKGQQQAAASSSKQQVPIRRGTPLRSTIVKCLCGDPTARQRGQ